MGFFFFLNATLQILKLVVFYSPTSTVFLVIICFSSSSMNTKQNFEVCRTFFTWVFCLSTHPVYGLYQISFQNFTQTCRCTSIAPLLELLDKGTEILTAFMYFTYILPGRKSSLAFYYFPHLKINIPMVYLGWCTNHSSLIIISFARFL